MIVKKTIQVQKEIIEVNGEEFSSIERATDTIGWKSLDAIKDLLQEHNKKIARRRGKESNHQSAENMIYYLDWEVCIKLHSEIKKWMDIKNEIEEYAKYNGDVVETEVLVGSECLN